MSDCCCEYAPRLREIEQRVEDMRQTIVDAAGAIDGEMIQKILSGDFQAIVMLLAGGSLANLLELKDLIPEAEAIAADHKAIVSEMEACCEDEEPEDPDEPEDPEEDEGEVALGGAVVASNSDRRVSGWPITAKITKVVVTDRMISFPFAPHLWPDYDGVVGNLWFMAKLGGEWHAGTVDWLRIRQMAKTLDVPEEHVDTAAALPTFIKEGPLASYVPQQGDECGIFVSSIARNNKATVNERSNVVLFTWPY